MSHDTEWLISVPRSCLTEFYSKYLNLVETFYYVTLSENKSALAKEKPEYVFFNVIFNLNPVDGNFNPRELVGKIQVSSTQLESEKRYHALLKFDLKRLLRSRIIILMCSHEW